MITADSATNISPRESTGKSLGLGILLSRLIFLGLGGGLAGCLGILLAMFYPNPNPEMPLVVKLLDLTNPQNPTGSSSASLASPAATSASQTAQLTPAQRQQLQIELQQLQAQIKIVGDRATVLETQLGSSQSNEPLETRLQTLSQQLQATPVPVPTETNPPVNASPSQSDALKLTLPTDILFQEGNSLLLPAASSILDKIITDLRNYPEATISIAAHTDDLGNAQDNRELSFKRALALEKYLAQAVGKKYRWIVVGYGNTHPLVVNNSEENRQRNRRVEISIDRE